MWTFLMRAAFPALLAVPGIFPLSPWAQAQATSPQVGDSIPSGRYYSAIEELYRGDYRDAQRILESEVRGSIKIGVTRRWIDAICYHTMLGEVYFQQGQPALALEQFDQACSIFLEYPNWLLRVEFKQPQPDTNRLQRPPPWGNGSRNFTLGRFPTAMLIRRGQLDAASQVLQRGGGELVQAQLWKVNVAEIARTTALAIRRRNELLGPLTAHDPISKNLLTTLSLGGAPPNHWSQAWVDIPLALASAGQGKTALALKRLQRAQRVAGRYDHPLTGIALLEMGRLQMAAGQLEQAQQTLVDASVAAFYFDDWGTLDEAIGLQATCYAASGTVEVQPHLAPAIAWARQERYHHILARLCLNLAEQQLEQGRRQDAASALQTAQAALNDARQGLLWNWAGYLEGRWLLADGQSAAAEKLLAAVENRIGMSVYNLQLAQTNLRFDQRQLPARSARNIYHSLLSDPAPADWVFWPLRSLAALRTPRHAAFQRWLAALPARDIGQALEVTDLAKRHRFLLSLPWGGRMAALRDVLELPTALDTPHARGQRNELLLRLPAYADAQRVGQALQATLRTQWTAAMDEAAQQDQVKNWRAWQANLTHREQLLASMVPLRVPADLQFPPVVDTTTWQKQLPPGQAVVVFHDTPDGLQGFFVTASSATRWNCGPSGRLVEPLQAFLRDLGNYDAQHKMSTKALTSDDWQASGSKLLDLLFGGASMDPGSMEELLVIPDGIAWYVPWTALPITTDAETHALIAQTRVRLAPTLGWAFGPRPPLRRNQHTGLAGHDSWTGLLDEQQLRADFVTALDSPIELPPQLPVPSATVAALLDTLVVLDESELKLGQPDRWSPIPLGRGRHQHTLGDWQGLPRGGPQRIILPATQTLAARGGKTRKRATAPPGSELFLASCGLLAHGAQTVLLSQWPVGGLSTLEITREFIQELPHLTAADAWQRSVQLAHELPIDAETEQRVQAKLEDPPLTAAHPFFWGGYLLLDISGTSGLDPAAPGAELPVTKPERLAP